MSNTAVTSLLGVVFWVGAARFYPPAQLGQDAGLIASMMLISSLSELSLSQGIPRLLPQVATRRRRAVLAAYVSTGLVALVLASAFVLLAPLTSSGFAFLQGDAGLRVCMVAAIVLWNIFALQDAVLAGLRRAIVVPIENGVFGVLKIALLALFAGLGVPHGVLVAWLLAMVMVLPPVNWLLFGRLLKRAESTADRLVGLLPLSDNRRLARFLSFDYLAALLTQGCTMLLPVLVLAMLGNAASAYFYVAFTISAAMSSVALALSTSLVVEGAHDERSLSRLTRRALVRSGVFLLPGLLLLAALAPLLLQPFGASYVEQGTVVLRLMLAGGIPQGLVIVYLGMERVRGRAGRILAVQALSFVLVLAGVAVFVPRAGLDAVGLVWIVAWSVAALVALPELYRAMRQGPAKPAAGRGPWRALRRRWPWWVAAAPPGQPGAGAGDGSERARGGEELDGLLGRSLKGLDLLAILFAQVEVSQHSMVVGLGVDRDGRKHALGAWQGSTSDRGRCKALLSDLTGRGLGLRPSRLFVIDGGAGMRAALRATFGRHTQIQRCRVHLRRAILGHLPEAERARFGRLLDEAWSEPEVRQARALLRALARDLRAADLGGAGTLLQGVDESLTVDRLGIPPGLRETLATTTEVERATGAVTNPRSGQRAVGIRTPNGAADSLLRAERRFRRISGHRDLESLARALDPGRAPATPERPAAESESAPPASPIRRLHRAGLFALALDLTALALIAALLVSVAYQIEGLPRQLLALAFVSFVPGWALVGRLELGDGIRPLVLAVPASLMLSAGGATIMLLLHVWRPLLLLAALALGSTALVSWTLIAPLRVALAASGSPVGWLLPRSLARLPRMSFGPLGRARLPGVSLGPLSRARLPAWLRPAAALSAASRAARVALPPARTGGHNSLRGRQRIWLAAIVIQLFWLVPAMSLVLVFALHPLTGVISLVMGVLAGVLLGVHRRPVLLVAAGLAAVMGGLLVIGWQSLPGGDLYSVAIAAFEISLDVWGPAALGGALGFATVPIIGHLEEQYGQRLGARVTPVDVSLQPLRDRTEDGGQLTGNGTAPHRNGVSRRKARRTGPADTKEVEPVKGTKPTGMAGQVAFPTTPSAEGRTSSVLAPQRDNQDQEHMEGRSRA
jgi:O-antigen/teichoic acid export membrane protein